MGAITLTIDGVRVKTTEGKRVLEAALDAGIYIPNVCALRDMKPFGSCRLCQIGVQGRTELTTACGEPAVDGMIVYNNSPEINDQRRKRLETILAKHPHACLTCHKRKHCRPGDICLKYSSVTGEQCILCEKNGRCDLQLAVDFIGLGDAPLPYTPRGLPIEADNPYIVRNESYCIMCARCVRVCGEMLGVKAITLGKKEGKPAVIGSLNSSLAESGCTFCGCCVEACPTGALTYAGFPGDEWPQVIQNPAQCRSACPAGVDVPRFVRAVADGKVADAQTVIREKVALPRISSRICSDACESKCRRTGLNGAVAVQALERFIADQDGDAAVTVPKPMEATGKRVAVVGSGPAALTAAYFLIGKGHQAVVLEPSTQLGGPLRGVGALTAKAVYADIKDLTVAGVTVAAGWDPVPAASLLDRGYDAVYLAAGLDAGNGEPGRKGICAGGEMGAGVSFNQATASGREMANAIDAYLGGIGHTGNAAASDGEQFPKIGRRPGFSGKVRRDEQVLASLSLDSAIEEAQRCMNCDLRARVARLVAQPAVPVRQRPCLDAPDMH